MFFLGGQSCCLLLPVLKISCCFFKRKSLWNTISLPNGSDPDQSVDLGLGLNWLQRLPAVDKSRRVNKTDNIMNGLAGLPGKKFNHWSMRLGEALFNLLTAATETN